MLGVHESIKFNPTEELTIEKLHEIVSELYPERKVYFRKTLVGRFVCVNINPFNAVFCKINTDKKTNQMYLRCVIDNTIMGAIFFGGIIAYLVARSKGNEIMARIINEIERRYAKG